MQEFLPVELAHAWGSVTCQNNFRARWSTYFDSYNWKICLGAKYWKKIVVGVHGDWVSHAEDLVDKYLPLYKERIIITKGGADRNTSIKKIIEAIDAYRPLTPEDIVVTHDSVRPFITLRMIQDNIQLAQNHDAVDTVVEAVDTIVESTNGQFITDIPNRAHLYQGQTPQTFRCKDFMDLYGSLSDEEKEILTDACKIFVIKGKDVALAKVNTQIWRLQP